MKVLLWPFYSQQDKATGKHLATCGNVRQCAFLSEQMDCITVIPDTWTEHPFKGKVLRSYIPSSNPLQRLHWDTRLVENCAGVDLVICNHEYMAIPLRTAFPNVRIIQMCSVVPDNALFAEAWRCADLVVAQNEVAAMEFRKLTNKPVSAWQMSFDERRFPQVTGGHRPIDVIFVQRCSSTNYSHHLEFLEAIEGTAWRVVFTDPTGWMRQQRPDLEYIDPVSGYKRALLQSKVAVSFCDYGYASQSIREAVRCGCVPVTGVTDPASIRRAIEMALREPGPDYRTLKEVEKQSYQRCWEKIREDLHMG